MASLAGRWHLRKRRVEWITHVWQTKARQVAPRSSQPSFREARNEKQPRRDARRLKDFARPINNSRSICSPDAGLARRPEPPVGPGEQRAVLLAHQGPLPRLLRRQQGAERRSVSLLLFSLPGPLWRRNFPATTRRMPLSAPSPSLRGQSAPVSISPIAFQSAGKR